MASLDDSTTIASVADQLSCEVDGETVILHGAQGKYFGLNQVGTFIWKLLEQPRTIREVRERMLAEFDVTREECDRDLKDLVQSLLDSGLVEIRPAA